MARSASTRRSPCPRRRASNRESSRAADAAAVAGLRTNPYLWERRRRVMGKNPVVHFEIYGDDPAALAQFYGSLFEWKIEEVPGEYRMVRTVETDAKGRPTQPGGI